MTSRLPSRISISKGLFAERAFSSQLGLTELPRLRDALQGDEVEITVSMQLHWDAQWRCPVMHLQMDLCLPLQCQRCMQSMQWEAQLDNSLLLVEQGATFDEPDEMDIAQARDGEIETLCLIEDEILLALPLAPLHDSDTACGRQRAEAVGGQQRADNPFAELAALKTKH